MPDPRRYALLDDPRLSQYRPSNEAVFEALRGYPMLYLVYRHLEYLAVRGGAFTNAELAEELHVSPRTVSFCVATLDKLRLVEAMKSGGKTFVALAIPAPDDVLEALTTGRTLVDMKSRKVDGWTPASRGRRQRLGVDASVYASETPNPLAVKQLDILGEPKTEETPKDDHPTSITSNALKRPTNRIAISGGPKIRRRAVTTDDLPNQPEYDAVLKVFRHWQHVFNYQHRDLTIDRWPYLQKLVAAGYPLDRMMRAVDNTKRWPDKMGQNRWKKYFTEVRDIFKDATTVDELADWQPPVTQTQFQASTRDVSNPDRKQTGGQRF